MINQNLKHLISIELEGYKSKVNSKNYSEAFKHLERIHIISQPFPIAHTIIHFRMLKFAIITFRPLEIFVQSIYTIFSFKFSALNIFPKGNTGGANAIFKGKMELPKDIELALMDSK